MLVGSCGILRLTEKTTFLSLIHARELSHMRLYVPHSLTSIFP